MRVLFLILLAVEVVMTSIGGVGALFMPLDFLPNILGAEPGAAAPGLTRMLGAVWIVVGLILASVPFLRDDRAVRSILLALMVGDVLHAGALIAAAEINLVHIIPSAVFFAYRGALVWRPQWLRATHQGSSSLV